MNKKGFTLIELLAVIIILGVLLLIAVPAVQNIIASSRRKSFESAAKLAIENVETLASTEKLEGALTECFVPLTDYTGGTTVKGIQLERGSFGTGASGYILVGANGKGTIYYSNNEYFVNGGTITSITASAQTTPATTYASNQEATYTLCTWWR